jgi:hypothetical protein
MPTPATLLTNNTARNIIESIRQQIPDPTNDPAEDGAAFTLRTLLIWLNDASRVLASKADVIQDWYALPSVTGRYIYELPSFITSIEQAWYDLQPLTRSAEADNLFTSKVVGQSWWFGPHSIHANPRFYVWPASNRNGTVTPLTADLSVDNVDGMSVASSAGFQEYGFLRIEDELLSYQTVATSALQLLLRGQGSTLPAVHLNGATVRECNIFFKCFRLPRPLTGVDDIIEIPQGLWPLLELYVMSKVKAAEQEMADSQNLMQLFLKLVDDLSSKAQIKGLRQGLQVRSAPIGPELYEGRVYVT